MLYFSWWNGNMKHEWRTKRETGLGDKNESPMEEPKEMIWKPHQNFTLYEIAVINYFNWISLRSLKMVY